MGNGIIEFAYAGRDNSIDIKLLEDGAPQDLTGLTRATLNLADAEGESDGLILLDSDLHPGIFDWSSRGADGILQINGGTLATTLAVNATFWARLTIYDLVLTNGLVWTHEITTGCTGTPFQLRVLQAVDGVAA